MKDQAKVQFQQLHKNVPSSVFSVLKIDLKNAAANYLKIKEILKSMGSHDTICSAVVKANAYGFGAVQISKSLFNAGCRDFFVADLEEAIELRSAVTEGNVYALCGAINCQELLNNNIIPVLISKEQVLSWAETAKKQNKKLPAIIHIDTGMTRTGISTQDVIWLINSPDVINCFDIKLVMSHLACSGEPEHELNSLQLERFESICKMFPGIPNSISATNGIFIGKQYHKDLIRPGRILYGLWSLDSENPMYPVANLYARVLQVIETDPGQSVGYGANYIFNKKGRIATIGIGYADGIPRIFGDSKICVSINGKKAPIVGSISMDLITVDVSDIEESLVYPGSWVTLLDSSTKLEDWSKAAGTVSLDVSCRFGKRLYRIYAE